MRFAFQQDVHQFISRSIREALEKNLQSPVEDLQAVYENISIKTNYEKPFYREASSWVNKPEEIAPFQQGDLSEALRNMTSSHGFHSKISSSPQQVMGFDKAPIPVSNLIYSEFEPLGQLNSSFIIMQGKKGLLVVDQHVAHERILYERFRKSAEKKKIAEAKAKEAEDKARAVSYTQLKLPTTPND